MNPKVKNFLIIVAALYVMSLIGRAITGEKTEPAQVEQKVEKVLTPQERFEKNFSGWDGSMTVLVKAVKESLNNPKSFEHVETRSWLVGQAPNQTGVVKMTFRAENGFGATITQTVMAKCDLDGNITSLELQ